MAVIKLSAWERNDLYRILDYAQDKKREELERKKITLEDYKREREKIFTIRQRLNGKDYKPDYELQSARYTGTNIQDSNI
jgi:3-dehydroquinate dehydratase